MYCDCCGPMSRRTWTKEEKIGALKEYKEYLEKEIKGVDETLTELKKPK